METNYIIVTLDKYLWIKSASEDELRKENCLPVVQDLFS